MKSAIYGILVAVMAVLLYGVILRALEAPVVFKDSEGKVCSCAMSDTKVPTKEICKFVDLNKGNYEVIFVEDCQKGQ